jgi:haloalkane dehalogenase
LKILRTPDARFAKLSGYPFAPHYVEIPDGDGGSLRIHCVDEGPRGATTVLLLHGEPTWSYLYRKMIPGLVALGYRVLAPDLVGFGRSDKPSLPADYTYPRHVAWLRAWVQAVDVRDAVFFGQDWGSLIGLAVVALEESRFRAAVLANGALPDPANLDRMAEAQKRSPDPTAFARWQAHAAAAVQLRCGDIVADGIPALGASGSIGLSPAERAAYDAPFPDASYQAGALVFPSLVQPEKLGAEGVGLFISSWRVLERWHKPFFTAYGKADPILGHFDVVFQKYVPGAHGRKHREFPRGTHFIQEQEPAALVEVIDEAARAR